MSYKSYISKALYKISPLRSIDEKCCERAIVFILHMRSSITAS